MAALPAHRALVRGWETRAAHRHRDAGLGNPGKIEIPLGERTFKLARARRPYRAAAPTDATPSSTTRPARRRATSRCASASRRSSRSKPRSCAAAASATLLPAHRSPSSSMWRSRAASRRRGAVGPVQGQTADARRRSRAGEARRRGDPLRERGAALPTAGALDVEEPLRPLRPSRAREGMVGGRRRGRGPGGEE